MQTKEPVLVVNLRQTLSMADLCTLAVLCVYTVLSLIFYNVVEKASFNILINILIASAIIALSIGDKLHDGAFFRLLHQFYVIPVIYLLYAQVHSYIGIFHSHDFDSVLIEWDHWLFNVNPTEVLAQIASPWLTEYLQATYMLFYFLPILQAVELSCRNKHTELKQFAYLMAFGFYVSHLLYFIMPAVGPRFTLHNFDSLHLELPGLWLTETFRGFVNAGGNISPGTPNPLEVVNRDCMPSGHTMMTLVNILLGFRFHSSMRWLFLLIGGSLIFATVYLRYHYVVDVIAGVILALLTLWVAPYLTAWVKSKGFTSLT